MTRSKIVFFGTPDFSVPTLKKLNENENIDVALVVTKPDKPVGRGEKITMSKVKEYALQNNLDVITPEKIKNNEEFINKLKSIDADYFIVVAYGKIFPKEILSLPKKACVNGHASLLPKYRGSSPIQYAILNGDDKSGTTAMLMSEGCDEGDMLLTKEIILDKKETTESLFNKLSQLTAEALSETILNFDEYYKNRTAQDHSKATNVKPIQKEDGKLDFSKSAIEIERQIRAMTPWPSAYTTINGKTVKIWDADVSDKKELINDKKEGEFIFTKNEIYAVCKNSLLKINELQPESKKRMKAEEFINGMKNNG